MFLRRSVLRVRYIRFRSITSIDATHVRVRSQIRRKRAQFQNVADPGLKLTGITYLSMIQERCRKCQRKRPAINGVEFGDDCDFVEISPPIFHATFRRIVGVVRNNFYLASLQLGNQLLGQ